MGKMGKMKRKTELSLAFLLDLLGRDDHNYSSCMLVNEVGIICLSGEDEDMAGRNKLISLLTDANPNHRAIAFSFLYLIDKEIPALAEFRVRPENQILLDMIDENLGN